MAKNFQFPWICDQSVKISETALLSISTPLCDALYRNSWGVKNALKFFDKKTDRHL